MNAGDLVFPRSTYVEAMIVIGIASSDEGGLLMILSPIYGLYDQYETVVSTYKSNAKATWNYDDGKNRTR